MLPWIGSARDLKPEAYPDEIAIVSLFEEGPYDDGIRALRSWIVKTSDEMATLCDTLDELIVTDRLHRPAASDYPLSYSATLTPKADRLDRQGIGETFGKLVGPPKF